MPPFLTPIAAFEDVDSPHQIITKQAGQLDTNHPHSPFDVVAWHGNYAPYNTPRKLQQFGFGKLGPSRPSILTVLTCPFDQFGRNAVDIAVSEVAGMRLTTRFDRRFPPKLCG